MKIALLDHGYVEFIEAWGHGKEGLGDFDLLERAQIEDDNEVGIIEAARMSTNKGFEGWDKDAKLLAYLYNHKHMTPFEMAGMTIEVKAPIFVFREWHRHRTQCLSPDTLVHFNAPKSLPNRKSVYKMRIEDIWKKWQPTERKDRPERQTNALFPRSRIQGMHLRCLDEDAREFGETRIVDVIKGEPKPMVKITTASGRQVTATLAHRVFTSEGWLPLGEAIAQRALLSLEGVTRAKATGWEVPLVERFEEWRPVEGWRGLYEVSSEGRVRRAGCLPKKATVLANGYPAVNLNRPGVQTLRTVHSLVLGAFSRLPLPGEEARHKNHNRLDARSINLCWGSSKDNSSDMLQIDRGARLVPVYEEIVSVEDMGLLPTYDLTVAGPWHNFVADGFVVHNSYNEMSARYIPLPDENYLPSIERCMLNGGTNKQANGTGGAVTPEGARDFIEILADTYAQAQENYEYGLSMGIPKELARLCLPVARYSRMRASANLRNWLAFITLRADAGAQWEIQQYANAVLAMISDQFPQTAALFEKGMTNV